MRLPVALFVCDQCNVVSEYWPGAGMPQRWSYREDDTHACPDCEEEHQRDLAFPGPMAIDILDPDHP